MPPTSVSVLLLLQSSTAVSNLANFVLKCANYIKRTISEKRNIVPSRKKVYMQKYNCNCSCRLAKCIHKQLIRHLPLKWYEYLLKLVRNVQNVNPVYPHHQDSLMIFTTNVYPVSACTVMNMKLQGLHFWKFVLKSQLWIDRKICVVSISCVNRNYSNKRYYLTHLVALMCKRQFP